MNARPGGDPDIARILVTGSRDFDDEALVGTALRAAEALVAENRNCSGQEDFSSARVIHGDYAGADRLAKNLVESGALSDNAPWRSWSHEPHPADWNVHGRAAGPIRNLEMIRAGADITIAFPRHTLDQARAKVGSIGTWGTIEASVGAGIPTFIAWRGPSGDPILVPQDNAATQLAGQALIEITRRTNPGIDPDTLNRVLADTVDPWWSIDCGRAIASLPANRWSGNGAF